MLCTSGTLGRTAVNVALLRIKEGFGMADKKTCIIFVPKDKAMITYPHAKINLGLYVVARRPDGYHNLETVFYPIPLTDVLAVGLTPEEASLPGVEVEVRQVHSCADYQFTLYGHDIDCQPEQNLIIKVLRMLKEEFPAIPYIYIGMKKAIPSGAGLGGGSADAAFMLRALNGLLGLQLSNEEMECRVAQLGADCAFFVQGVPVLATGIGNVFAPVAVDLSGLWLTLVKPDVFVSTKEAYAQVRPTPSQVDLTQVLRQPVATWRDAIGNDFEPSVFACHPEIAAVKERLYALGADFALMSGSGSCVYALSCNRLDDNALQACFGDMFWCQYKL